MMDILASWYSRNSRSEFNPRPLRQEDLTMYALILGKPVDIAPAPQPGRAMSATARPWPARAMRVWARSARQITYRLRDMWGRKIAPEAKQQQVAGWLRSLSEEAFKRLDQAQVRLNTPRYGQNRRRVESREVMSIRPVEHDYKRVA